MSSWGGTLADLGRTETRRGRRSLGMFRIEGTRLHERALRAGAPIVSVLVGREWAAGAGARERTLLDGLRDSGAAVIDGPDATILELTEGRESGTLAGLVRMPREPRIEEIVSGRRPAVVLVALDVEDPGNVGALVRTALGCGACGFIAAGVSEPYHPRAVRTSMGSLFRLPVLVRPDGAGLLEELAGQEVCTWAAVSRGGVSPDAPDGPGAGMGPIAIVMGSEAFGLPAEVLGRIPHTVSIPMPDPVDSLSVNAAAAVLLWEVARSRPS